MDVLVFFHEGLIDKVMVCSHNKAQEIFDEWLEDHMYLDEEIYRDDLREGIDLNEYLMWYVDIPFEG